MCFNPRAREGRDAQVQVAVYLIRVSIHAPAKGATCWLLVWQPSDVSVSIHAPAKGATAVKSTQEVET